MQLLNSINMKLQSRDWRCVSGLQKCMEYHMRGGNIVLTFHENKHNIK